MAGIGTRELWSTALVYTPIAGFALSILLSPLFRGATGRVVRVSRAWAVVLVINGVWVFCAAVMARGTLRSYTGVGGEPWTIALANLLVVFLFLGLPIVKLAAIVAIVSQIVHIVSAVRAAKTAPTPSSEAGGQRAG